MKQHLHLSLLAIMALAASTALGATPSLPTLSIASTPVTVQMVIPAPPDVSLTSTSRLQLIDMEMPEFASPVGVVGAVGADGLAVKDRYQLVVAIKPGKEGDHLRHLQLQAAKPLTNGPSNDGPKFAFTVLNEQSLGLYEGKRPVLVYNYGVMSRTNVPEDRRRSSYVHPLYGLDGEVLTDDFPKDHYHHRGLFWAWPHVKIDGRESSLWDLRGIRHQFEHWLRREVTPDVAILGVENGWYQGNHKVMQERIWFQVYPALQHQQAIDIHCTWIPTDKAVTLEGAEGKSYGGLTLRYAPHTNLVVTTPLGQQTNDWEIKRLPWADLTAQFMGTPEKSGAAIFIDPQHPDYPPTWLTRHYGVLCVGWPGVTPLTFKPGELIHCSYRVWIHRKEYLPTTLEQVYQGYNSLRSAQWETKAK